MKDNDEWEHNVVTRPVREMIKLFELGDTTFAEDISKVHKAAKDILVQKGALKSDESAAALDFTLNGYTDSCDANSSALVTSQTEPNLAALLNCTQSDWFNKSSCSSSGLDLDETMDICENEELLFMI